MHKMLFLMVLILYAVFTTNVALAQLSEDNPSEKKALSNVGLSSPLIQKISDKGIFNITIKSGQSSIPSGLNFEIVFLNGSSPNLEATPSGAESNATLDSPTATGLTVPSVIEHVVPVKSFDIRVTSNDGQELLKKVNEIPRGGRILENVNLNNYIGNITINLDNFVPDVSVNDTIKKQSEMAANQTDVRDSVKIDGQVVIS
ncbi:MAG: hypothetical protein WA393_13795 [Nitrososphaeraceae archaeon]